MLKTWGIGVAMGTAIPEVKQAADYFTLSCNQDGVAWWLEKKISEFKTKVLILKGMEESRKILLLSI